MAEVLATAPATHSQPSRKGKKAWRKNVDISEVQQGLETVRDEIIKGGVIAERDADALFTTDLAGDAGIEPKNQGKKLLKAEEIIALRSVVPGLDGRKRKAEVEHETTGKKAKNGEYISRRELQRLRRIADGEKNDVTNITSADYDPWAPTAPAFDGTLDFLDPPKPVREPKSMKQAPVPLTTTGKPVPHVRKPEGGKSYNPLVGDWSSLLEREGQAAVETEQERLAREAQLAEWERKAHAEAARVEATEKDEYATDYESAWESEWEGIQSGTEEAVHTAKQSKRKTPAERNKVKARKEREAREKWEKKQKLRDAQEKRIREIARELSARDRARRPGTVARTAAVNDSSDDSSAEEVRLRRQRFGKLQVPDGPLEVTLPEDLQDSLRRLKPEGNLLAERYRNLLINGKLEVRKKVGQVKQKKVFRTEKWGYKDWKLR